MRDLPVVVVLAAGRGRRFEGEGPKLAQPLGPSSVLAQTLDQVLAAGLPVVVVTTAGLAPLAQRVVAARDIVILSPAATRARELMGVGHSIAAGVSARAHANGWLVLPADLPLVRPATLRRVALALRHHPVVYAQHRGRRGHPVGFSAELYTELAKLNGDEGARRLVTRYPAQAVEVEDHGVWMDVDTEADLQAVRAVQAESAESVKGA